MKFWLITDEEYQKLSPDGKPMRIPGRDTIPELKNQPDLHWALLELIGIEEMIAPKPASRAH